MRKNKKGIQAWWTHREEEGGRRKSVSWIVVNISGALSIYHRHTLEILKNCFSRHDVQQWIMFLCPRWNISLQKIALLQITYIIPVSYAYTLAWQNRYLSRSVPYLHLREIKDCNHHTTTQLKKKKKGLKLTLQSQAWKTRNTTP